MDGTKSKLNNASDIKAGLEENNNLFVNLLKLSERLLFKEVGIPSRHTTL